MSQYTITITHIHVDGKKFTLMRLLDALIHSKPIVLTAYWVPTESTENEHLHSRQYTVTAANPHINIRQGTKSDD